MTLKIDPLAIDMKAGKHWMDRVHDEKVKKRLEMTDWLLDWMKKNHVPITREKYLALAYGTDQIPDPWTEEHEAELPPELRLTKDSDKE
jgi:hypothetical protein